MRGQVPPHNARVRVFVFDRLVVFVLVAGGEVLFVVGAGGPEPTPAVRSSRPELFVVAEPSLLLAVLQVVDPVVVDMSGAVRPPFPVIVLLPLLVTKRKLFLAVHHNGARVQLPSHVVLGQTGRRGHQYLASDFDMVVLVVLEACHETTRSTIAHRGSAILAIDRSFVSFR